MSDSGNPWQSPGAVIEAEEGSAQGGLTAVMLRYLKEASPWLRFVGVMGYIGAGLLAGGGVILAIVFAATGETVFGTGVAGGFGALAGFLYLVLGAMLFFPARFTHQFGAKIRNYLLSNAEQDLEEALKNNKSLWKFYGIYTIVGLAIVPVAIIGAVIVAITSSVF